MSLTFRSKFEQRTAQHLKKKKIVFEYESLKIKWQDLKIRTYTPDFILPNGILIETKGRFTASDRRKHLEIKKQHPNLDIRFVFQRSLNVLYKGSKTTYADWCIKHGFKFADGTIPDAWLREKPKDDNTKSTQSDKRTNRRS
jgi:hypothetical protein